MPTETIMEQTPVAMTLRTPQTIDSLGAGPANTIVMFPMELTQAIGDVVEPTLKKGGVAVPHQVELRQSTDGVRQQDARLLS